MSISDELAKLAELKEAGVLTAEEFEQAKKKTLSDDGIPNHVKRFSSKKNDQFEDKSDHSVGKAANRYVSFQMMMAVIAIILFLLFFAPMMCNSGGPGFSPGFPR
ncbi:MAG: SHOCT domain-containing protein [Verrucomicrobiota bacterium]